MNAYVREISDFFQAITDLKSVTAVDFLKALFDQPAIAEPFRARGLSTATVLDATCLLDDVSESGAQRRASPAGQHLGMRQLLTDKMTDLALELLGYMSNPKFAQEWQEAKAANRKFTPTVEVLQDIRSFTKSVLVSLRDRVCGVGMKATDIDALIAALG